MVTGESLPVGKAIDSQVIGASVNTTGTLRVRATKVGSDTALAHIVALVQQAQNSKAPGQRLADRAAFWLVLVALLGGTATFLVWLAVGRPVTEALLFAITVVVITCPTRWAWQLQQRSWSAPEWAPNEVCCSRTQPLWRPRPTLTPW